MPPLYCIYNARSLLIIIFGFKVHPFSVFCIENFDDVNDSNVLPKKLFVYLFEKAMLRKILIFVLSISLSPVLCVIL